MMLYFWQGSRLALLQNVRNCGLKHGRLARRSSVGPWITTCRVRRVQPWAHSSTSIQRRDVSRLPASPSVARLPTYCKHGSCSLVPVLRRSGAWSRCLETMAVSTLVPSGDSRTCSRCSQARRSVVPSPIAASAAGSRRVLLHHPLYPLARSRSAAQLLSTLKLC
jgi:hypothetical protein